MSEDESCSSCKTSVHTSGTTCPAMSKELLSSLQIRLLSADSLSPAELLLPKFQSNFSVAKHHIFPSYSCNSNKLLRQFRRQQINWRCCTVGVTHLHNLVNVSSSSFENQRRFSLYGRTESYKGLPRGPSTLPFAFHYC